MRCGILLVVAEVFLFWKADCGVAVRGARRCWDLPAGHRPHRPHRPRAAAHATHHFNAALPLKSVLGVSGSS